MKKSIKTKLDEMAYERDNFQCVKCGRAIGIEAHHKIPNLEELDNLITLCHSCHKKEHKMAGCFKKGHDPKRKAHDKSWMIKITRKLTDVEVKEIRKLRKRGMLQRKIAYMFDIHQGTVSNICLGKRWKY